MYITRNTMDVKNNLFIFVTYNINDHFVYVPLHYLMIILSCSIL